ncbi:mechanosensitive ion channel family protein [Gilvimarinus sp. SDUM040013]|uniref:Mechanosensitive ion channel family protein n=1 Tax=Gilvimarinus gilvus TaxID=3058038 RepID=A0ABU4RSL0_9GAMM|nr:mechanosensitive ion channel family protein [Gilvimarinus sp. SDUM040013]MDO3388320.1 mechanosensitive ion channel family protein [Gilvimarinus sp. SDUM040013]MDX6847870.1 mechanosensitive ion channel family protein [Gilvimarinus sp. SDUM040013]
MERLIRWISEIDRLFGISLIALALAFTSVASAEEVTFKDVVQVDGQAVAKAQRKQVASPLATAMALRAAGERRDWELAAKYADFRFLSDNVLEQGKPELIRKLALMWEQHQIIDLTSVSDDPAGRLDDGLPEYREALGSLTYGNEQFVVYLQRVPDGNGGQIWKISNATIAQIPQMWQIFGYDPRLERLGQWLPKFQFYHMQNWQFLLLILVFVLAWLVSGIVKKILLWLISFTDIYRDTMQRLIRRPLRLFLMFSAMHWGVYQLGLPLRVRVFFDTGIFLYLAGMFLILGIVEFAAAWYISRSLSRDSQYTPGFLRPMVSVVKIFIVILAVLFWLDNAGYNMATVLTGLGIGSLAVALAAQKTLENVFGAFTLYIARPIKPGDFCRFGDVVGVVEEIGLRSTRLRQLNRAVVNVPNSVFSSKELENLSEIDKRLYRQRFCLSHTTSTQTVNGLLESFREILQANENILELSRRVHFEEISQRGFEVQVNAYFDTADFAEFLQLSEKINLQLLEAIENAGAELVQWFMPEAK